MMERKRKEILSDLLNLNGSVSALIKELSRLPWDIKEPILNVKPQHLLKAISIVGNREDDFNLIEEWANAVEVRDDLEFESDLVQELIEELANPILNGGYDLLRLKDIEQQLLSSMGEEEE